MSEIRVYTNLAGGFFIGDFNENTGLLSDLALIMMHPQAQKFMCVPANIITEDNKFHRGYIGDIDPDKMNWVQCNMVDKSIIDQYITLATGITMATANNTGGDNGQGSLVLH